MTNTYTEPVSELLDRGETSWSEWDDYLALGFAREHIPDLIRVATDQHLIAGGETLKNIAEQYPDTLDQVKGVLLSALELFEENDEELNGFLMGDLPDLKAVEAMSIIRQAFAANAIGNHLMNSDRDTLSKPIIHHPARIDRQPVGRKTTDVNYQRLPSPMLPCW